MDLPEFFNKKLRIKNMLLPVFICTILLTCCHEASREHTMMKSPAKTSHFFGDTVTQLGNNIMVVYHDSKNIYWFGSWETGLYKFNGKSIVHYTIKDGLPSNRIEEIKEDSNGNIFINTNAGLCQYDSNRIIKIQESLLQDSQWKLRHNDLWFKSPKPGFIYRYDGKSLHALKIPQCSIGEEYLSQHPKASDPYAIYCIYKDSKGNIWFGTALLGALRYNGKSFDWISESDVTELHDGPANGVRSIVEDKDGYFWFNSEYRYKILDMPVSKGEKFYERLKNIGSLDNKKDGDLKEYLSITRDYSNALWIATYRDGVWYYDGSRVTHHAVQENGNNIHLFYIYTDTIGNIWLGTHENGAWKYNGKIFHRFTP